MLGQDIGQPAPQWVINAGGGAGGDKNIDLVLRKNRQCAQGQCKQCKQSGKCFHKSSVVVLNPPAGIIRRDCSAANREMLFREQAAHILEGLELERVATGIEKKHRRLLADLTFKTDMRLNNKLGGHFL